MASANQSMFTASQVCQLLREESGDEISASDNEIEVIISDTCHCLSCPSVCLSQLSLFNDSDKDDRGCCHRVVTLIARRCE